MRLGGEQNSLVKPHCQRTSRVHVHDSCLGTQTACPLCETQHVTIEREREREEIPDKRQGEKKKPQKNPIVLSKMDNQNTIQSQNLRELKSDPAFLSSSNKISDHHNIDMKRPTAQPELSQLDADIADISLAHSQSGTSHIILETLFILRRRKPYMPQTIEGRNTTKEDYLRLKNRGKEGNLEASQRLYV